MNDPMLSVENEDEKAKMKIKQLFWKRAR